MPTDFRGSDLPQAFFEPFDVTSASNFAARWASGSLVSNGDDVATFYSALLGGKPAAAARQPEGTRRPSIFRVRTSCGFAWGHGGVAGYMSYALASEDGSRVVFLGANAFAPGSFEAEFDRRRRACTAQADTALQSESTRTP